MILQLYISEVTPPPFTLTGRCVIFAFLEIPGTTEHKVTVNTTERPGSPRRPPLAQYEQMMNR